MIETIDVAPARDCLARARALTALVESEADAAERDATITKPVVDAIADNRLFWLLVPEDLGGCGLSLVDSMRVLEEVSRADGSTGWALMANVMLTGVAAGFLSSEGAQELFGGPEPGVTAGMVAPTGTARRVPEGYLISGRFQFASGSAHATWIGAGAVVVDEQGTPEVDENGSPVCRIVFVPREEVDFLGNWDVMGMVATGSYDYAVVDTFVPEVRTINPLTTQPARPEPVFKLGVFGIGVGGHAPVAIGLATRALEELAEVVSTKSRNGYAATVAESEMFRRDFARYEALLQAARLYVYDAHARAEETAAAGREPSAEQLARMMQARTWVQEVAVDIVGFAHRWGGSQGIRNPSALGRCMRDMAVATTHALIDPMTLVDSAQHILPGYVRSTRGPGSA